MPDQIQGGLVMYKTRPFVAAMFTAVIALGTTAAAHAGEASPPFTQVTRVHGTIVDVAVSNPSFSTLVTALQAAGLVSTLQGPGPFTVFAPTNSAFGKL